MHFILVAPIRSPKVTLQKKWGRKKRSPTLLETKQAKLQNKSECASVCGYEDYASLNRWLLSLTVWLSDALGERLPELGCRGVKWRKFRTLLWHHSQWCTKSSEWVSEWDHQKTGNRDEKQSAIPSLTIRCCHISQTGAFKPTLGSIGCWGCQQWGWGGACVCICVMDC